MSILLRPEMESALEWVLFAALASSGLCMAAVALMIIFGRFRVARTPDAQKRAVGDKTRGMR